MSRSTEERDSGKSRGGRGGLPKRWSARRKAGVVLRLLGGEEIGDVSREVRVAPPELKRRRRPGSQEPQQKNGLIFKPPTRPENRNRYGRT